MVSEKSLSSASGRRSLDGGDIRLLTTLVATWLAISLSLAGQVNGEDHCSEHRYNNSIDTDHMQFTKEVPDQEYGILGQFKSLHCCAKGYRSIEWFKNGHPYPWGSEISSLIVYPEAANQTIYTHRISETDIGNYSCVLRNDTGIMRHDIELRMQEDKPDYPLPTFKPKDTIINLGETARFYCEAFVGKLDLPDATNKIVWMQMFDDKATSILDANQLNVTREDGQIIGSYLSIPNIKQHHYGRYRCQITSGNLARPLELSVLLSPAQVTAVEESEFEFLALIIISAVALLLLIMLFVICRLDTRKDQHDNRCSAQFIADNESV
ncbi:fibroblast growth factor receptor 2-like [Topomyia yanbarensis]|uniref:fibroblast growth factor receptor 2-like n=1 Tax=Topomyia yanbarensis TaxID=2498891 RepID=UPI00273B4B06|nr:fibroblast growth factor receptor 2-like [Topomyia yanbarensis]